MYQNDAMKVLTGECRLSYCNLTTPRAAQQGGEHQIDRVFLADDGLAHLGPDAVSDDARGRLKFHA